MSKLISIKINDDVLASAEKFIKKKNISRSAYVNQALQLMNKIQERRKVRKTLLKESKKVRDESMAILREFDSTLSEGIEGLE
ncbi:MAG: hypothetical protein ACKVQC_02460 [Elusimicrobiota bacterium]